MQAVTLPQQNRPAAESPANTSGVGGGNPFQNDPSPTEQPNALPSPQSTKPANQSPQLSTPEPQTLNPVPSTTLAESQALMPNAIPSTALGEPQVETSFGIRQQSTNDGNLRSMDDAAGPIVPKAQTRKALSFQGQPLIESSISQEELERRRSFIKAAVSSDAFP